MNPRFGSFEKIRFECFFFAGLFTLQLLLFTSYMARAVSPNPVLLGDTTWFTYFCYEFANALHNQNYLLFPHKVLIQPWGVLLWLESVATQHLFGGGRTSLVVINLLHYFLAQLSTYIFFLGVYGSRRIGMAALLLFLSLHTPFRGAETLTIIDFHPDFIAMCILMAFYYAIYRSYLFADRKMSMVTAGIAIYLTYMRLVTFFNIVAICGIFLVMLLADMWTLRLLKEHREKIKNFVTAAALYLVFTIPHLLVSGRAVWAHYFNFVFDPEFLKNRIMYTYGLSGAWEGMAWVLRRVLLEDFGLYFWAALTGCILAALWAARTWQKIDRGLVFYLLFLLLSCALSLYQHGVFPIKSAHLTRLTMAPLFIIITIAFCEVVHRAQHALENKKLLGALLLAIPLSAAAINHLAFYTSSGRAIANEDRYAIEDTYERIYRYAMENNLPALRISIDFVDPKSNYFLGALKQASIYAYERHQVFFDHVSKLGGVLDQPTALEDALRQLKESDIALVTPEYVPNSWPLTQSIAPMHDRIMDYIKTNFAFAKRYEIFGTKHDLYFRHLPDSAWEITASQSTSEYYGPRLLTTEPRIWHAKWDGSPQWVEFASKRPALLNSLTLIAQDKGFDRAPRDFSFLGSNDGANWQELAARTDAHYDPVTRELHLPLLAKKPYARYRLVITNNSGNSDLLTIQNVHFNGTAAGE